MNRHSIVAELHAARSEGRAVALPAQEIDVAEALSLQIEVAKRFVDSGNAIGGWKVGMTSGSSRDKLGADVRPFGYILENRILSSDAEVKLSSLYKGAIEPELCLLIAEPLEGEVTESQARAAVGAVAAAFEINEYRIADQQGSGLLVADGLANWGIVVGSEAPVTAVDSNISVELKMDETIIARTTSGIDVEIDDHFSTLRRLCSQLAAFGLGVEPGTKVITGKFAGGFPLDSTGHWSAEYSAVGSVAVDVR